MSADSLSHGRFPSRSRPYARAPGRVFGVLLNQSVIGMILKRHPFIRWCNGNALKRPVSLISIEGLTPIHEIEPLPNEPMLRRSGDYAGTGNPQ
jgi:hypothetical protein